MLRFGLKAKFTFNLLVILLIAMLMLDFVIMMVTRQALIQARSEKAQVVITALEALAFKEENRQFNPLAAVALLKQSNVACSLLVDNHSRSYRWGDRCFGVADLSVFAAKATAAGKTIVEYIGSTWDFFYTRSQYMVVAAPVTVNGRSMGSICLVYDMKRVYASLARTQKLIFYYILINALLLTFLGVYRLWQITGRPLQKLVRRADEFQPDGDLLFLSDEEESEFNRLSRSLNRMLANIDEDKKKLKSTVLSLEAANAELQKAHKEMIRTEKMASVGRLSSGIAHEIGNPIGIVLGYLDLLGQPDLTAAERADYIARAQDEIGRVNNIIRELLDFSRPAREETQAVSVHAIIDEITAMLRQQPMMNGIDLECRLAADTDVVTVDPQRLRQVFLNLLINASDAITPDAQPPGGHILIESRNNAAGSEPAGQLQVVVADDGPGIPEDELNNIFDPFYTTKEPGKGTGLGLWVSFMIMEETGGTLSVEAGNPEGTRFILTFPLVERKAT